MVQAKEYFAFISYKREDEKWAKWLAHELEHYHLPTTLNGKDLPKNLRPVFRDVDELSAGNLPTQIYNALSISKNLIVVCSPRSAKSEWVDKEIEDFLMMKGGKADNIYPFIIEGVPFSEDAEKECFPKKLRNLPKNEERLGGNINEQGGRKAAVVKIVAGLLGIGFDSLWQKYEREQKKKRYMIIAASLLFALVSLGIAGWMINKDWEIMKIQSRAVAEQANILTDQGDSYTARMILLEVLPRDWSWKYWPNRPLTEETEAAFRKCCRNNSALLRGHQKDIGFSVFSPNGRFVAYVYDNNIIRIWDSRTDTNVLELNGHTKKISSITYSPKGNNIASASYDKTIRVWDAITGNCLDTLLHEGNVESVEFSKDGDYLVSASHDRKVRVWDVKKGVCIKSFPHNCAVRSASFSSDNQYVVTAGCDAIRIWDVYSDSCVKVLKGHTEFVNSAHFSPNNKNIISASNDETIQIWDVDKSTCLDTLKGHSSYVNYVSYSKDGKRIASASLDNTVRVWDANTGKCIQILEGHRGSVNCVSFSSDGKRLVSSADDCTTRVWEILWEQSSKTLTGHTSVCNHASFCPNPNGGIIIASASVDNTIRLWNVNKETCTILEGHRNPVEKVNFSPDGRFVVSASLDNTIRIWDIEKQSCIDTLTGHEDDVNDAVYSPDGKNILSASNDKTIRIWDTKTGQCVKVLKYYSFVKSISFSSNGSKMLIFSSDNIIRIWNNKIGELKALNVCTRVHSSAISPNGKLIVSGNDDNTIFLWDTTTNNPPQTLYGHKDGICSVIFSPKGDYIISASRDGTIRVWNSKTGRCVDNIYIGDVYVLSASFLNDESKIVTASTDGVVRIWDFPPLQQLIDETRERFKDRKLTPEERRKYYLK